MSYNYYVRSSSGKETRLCRTTFLSVHGLQKNKGSIKSILKQQRQGRLTPESDRRGKHQNRPNKWTDEDIAHVLVHIDKFPTLESNYSRNHNPNRKYLGSELTISHMYSLYKEWCVQQKFNIVSKDKYFWHKQKFGTFATKIRYL